MSRWKRVIPVVSLALGSFGASAWAQAVEPPEVANACGAFVAPDANMLEPFDVTGQYLSFVFDPTISGAWNVSVLGQPVFQAIRLASPVQVDRLELDEETMEARGDPRLTERRRARLEAQDCENALFSFDWRPGGGITFELVGGYLVRQLDADSVLIARNPLSGVALPLLMRIDGEGPIVAQATDTTIVFAGEGTALFRVVTAADQVPDTECLPGVCVD